MGAEDKIEILKNLIRDNEVILEHSRAILLEMQNCLHDPAPQNGSCPPLESRSEWPYPSSRRGACVER